MSTPPRTFRYSRPLTRTARRIAAATGRATEEFRVELVSDGSICVRGPAAHAFYPPGTWLQLFTRHLERGIFDR